MGKKKATCQKCQSGRLVRFIARAVGDCQIYSKECTKEESYGFFDVGIKQFDGPEGIDMTFCADCGQIQGEFPLPPLKEDCDEDEGCEDEDFEDED